MTQSIEEMKADLQRQILEEALTSDNPQFKLDVFKAVVERSARGSKPVEPDAGPDPMQRFRARVSRAESGNGPDPD